MSCNARFLRPVVLSLGLVLALAGVSAPARAQFFFPFFDNRPSTPPGGELRRREPSHRAQGGILDLRSRSRPHRAKSRLADRKPQKSFGPSKYSKSNKPAEAAKAVAAVNPSATPAPVVEGPPPPYEPQLLRLSEIMGALAYLQSICAAPPPGAAAPAMAAAEDHPWRERMQTLMTAEAAGPARREKLAGAYNRGLQGYEYSYHVCTPNAQLARRRFLDEGERLAHEITTQYRAN